MFKVKLLMNDAGDFESFKEAFKTFWDGVLTQIGGGTHPQFLETANFIYFDEPDRHLVMGLCAARDYAYEVGLLVGDGDFNETADDPPYERTASAFQAVSNGHMADMAAEIGRRLRSVYE